ncbi:NF038120 family PEP-CTERM protein [Massilia yuzhufengensis]|uniref:PEP-CTERM protein-sorting domain-containing protein n=1 Tax=Massilia yuzhufengensis TaxID=1164594 RepID=A0A1I1PJ60_9BURK|nr:NF038120 family PEP-CTERM protein [Massilia yuzhufengensis]SFD07003.1 PEP-CTERM protein-sorting domain-containing protein [Massilia yuzhufengensis]
MKKFVKLAVMAAIASACASASAGVVTFETFLPGIYTNGEQLVNDDQQITVRGQGGFDGALINGRDPSSCDLAVCPAGNSTNYYTALNDGGFSFSLLSGNTFGLSSIDFGFVLPIDMVLNFSVGKLMLMTNDGTTASRDFSLQNAGGDYTFTRWNFGNTFSQGAFSEVTFSACLYDGLGDCVNPAGNQAQFAVDNLAFVPEPGTVALVSLSLMGMLGARRRKSV